MWKLIFISLWLASVACFGLAFFLPGAHGWIIPQALFLVGALCVFPKALDERS